MRPNSKTYNADFGSSFQRQSYRTFQAKPKTTELDRWDHSGYEQLQLEHQDKSSKFPRNRKNQPDNTMAADSIDNSSRGRGGFNQEKVRWAHDKYQETGDDFSELKSKEESGVKETVLQQETKTKRRPDRQLYNVRQKHSVKTEETTKKATETPTCKKEESSPCFKGAAKDVFHGLDEKEIHSTEDDKLSISNVSTAMSDRLRNWEEESYLKSEFLKDRVDTSDLTHSPKDNSKESLEVLFDIVLETEHGVNHLKIYQGEEDYETVLESMCNKSNFDARTALYFKINMMQMIVEAGLGNEKVSSTLDKLLDMNYKVLMCESGVCEADESIASYLEKESRENEFILGNLEDSY